MSLTERLTRIDVNYQLANGMLTIEDIINAVTPPAPVITSITPDTAPIGGDAVSITVTGTGFDLNTQNISFGGYPQEANFVSDTEILLSVADVGETGYAEVIIVDSDGYAMSNGVDFLWTDPVPLTEPEIAIPDIPLDPTWTVDEVKQWVGSDHARAQEALNAEEARETPRITLVTWLTALLAT